jgi:DNA polymerase I
VKAPLALVDGHNLLWRAAFGFPAVIRANDGSDRTAVFAFFALLRVALREIAQPAECVVCFDGEHGARRRQEVDAGYKGNRKEIDKSPLLALPDVKRGLEQTGVPWVEIEDREADDVIASLVRLEPDRMTYVMSTDRDFFQIVSDRVHVLNTARAGGRRVVMPDFVLEQYGVGPVMWCDFKSLAGDPADNIPGVRRVGARTAARLLDGGLTLEELRTSDRLTGRVGKAVAGKWDQVLAWRDLIRFDDGVPVPWRPSGDPTPALPSPAAVLEELRLW